MSDLLSHWGDQVMDAAPYRVVCADPPWPHNNLDSTNLKPGNPFAAVSVTRHYRLMSVQEICAIPVEPLMDDFSVLYLWSPWHVIPAALSVMRSWGFKYSTGLPWLKRTAAGKLQSVPGFWMRNCSETLLLGFRGKVPRRYGGQRGGRAPMKSWELAIIEEARVTHSTKPIGAYELIERQLDGPYLELFARRRRPGWTSWGDELKGGAGE